MSSESGVSQVSWKRVLREGKDYKGLE